MTKFDIARALDEISNYLELSEANHFRAIAFERAATAVRGLEREPADLIQSGTLLETPGIGKATAAIIDELVRTGTSNYLEELRGQYPAGIFELMRVPKLGMKKIGILYETLGVASLRDLEEAARQFRPARAANRVPDPGGTRRFRSDFQGHPPEPAAVLLLLPQPGTSPPLCLPLLP